MTITRIEVNIVILKSKNANYLDKTYCQKKGVINLYYDLAV
jgi:hypothetical protein